MTIDGYQDVPPNDENSLKKAVANQPVSVAVESGGRAFQLYQSVRHPGIHHLMMVCFSALTFMFKNDTEFKLANQWSH